MGDGESRLQRDSNSQSGLGMAQMQMLTTENLKGNKRRLSVSSLIGVKDLKGDHGDYFCRWVCTIFSCYRANLTHERVQ